ncbi:bifunctional folylpolyglutamate synthase/dihydrofolate synthase [Candidatus Omnitrophota bacterium]
MKITGYAQAVRFLESFIDYERGANPDYFRSWKLSRVRRLLTVLKIDLKKLRVIHVAGTKGKGSTATFIASILAGCGFKTGLYTSPHLDDFRERITILKPKVSSFSSSSISRPQVTRLVSAIAPLISRLNRRLGREGLSFFEVYTAIAFKYFLDQKADLVVLECGLGGRLDATNTVRPLVSVITHIGYDHTKELGETLAKIAFEKAGIIKKRIPVVSARQSSPGLKVLRQKSRDCKSSLYVYDKDFSSRGVRIGPKLTRFDLSTAHDTYKDLTIGLKGIHQVENASLAVASCELLKDLYPLSRSGIYQGLRQAVLPARFEVVKNKKLTFLFDIAHNPSSIEALDRAIKTYFPGRAVVVVFGSSGDKDIAAMLARIDLDRLILTRADHPRAASPGRIKMISPIKDALIEPDIEHALAKARTLGLKTKALIVVTGSLFLVAEAKRLLRDEG